MDSKEKKKVKVKVKTKVSKTKTMNKTNGLGKSAGTIMAAPVAYSQKQSYSGTKMSSRRIVNSEMIGDVTGTTLWTATRYDVNPGLAASFPWLNEVAKQWQQYCFHRLRYRFVTRSSTATVGSIILSPEYSTKDTPPYDEKTATNGQDAVEDVCWREITCTMDPRSMFPNGPRKLVRTYTVPYDRGLYDGGILYVGAIGMAGTAVVGKLWVDYDVEFFTPQTSSFGGPATASSVMLSLTDDWKYPTTGVITRIPYDFRLSPINFGYVYTGADVGKVGLPIGAYTVTAQIAIVNSVSAACTATLYIRKGGVALPNYPSDPYSRLHVHSYGGAGSMVSSTWYVVQTDPTDVIEICISGVDGTNPYVYKFNSFVVIRPV